MISILVVDDAPCWQEFVRARLEGDSSFCIIGTALNGNAAIRKAEELQPDLVLLDVSLPGMCGIAAAREIRRVAPNSTILFVSGESDPEIVRAALDAGGSGYVLKIAASKDLLAGMAEVLSGKRFLSGDLRGLDGPA